MGILVLDAWGCFKRRDHCGFGSNERRGHWRCIPDDDKRYVIGDSLSTNGQAINSAMVGDDKVCHERSKTSRSSIGHACQRWLCTGGWPVDHTSTFHAKISVG